MKKAFTAFVLILAVFVSCSKSSNDLATDPFSNSLITKAAYDNTSFGIYKGVVIGSTGTIILRVHNGDSLVKGYLNIDNQKDTLSVSEAVLAGQPISNILFTGSFSSMRLSANADGSEARITDLNISGHPKARVTMMHENSNNPVTCYEGVFTGEVSGKVCFLKFGLINNVWGPVSRHIAKLNEVDVFSTGWGYHAPGDTVRLGTQLFMEEGATIINFNGRGNFVGNTFVGSFNTWTPLAGPRGGTFTTTRTYRPFSPGNTIARFNSKLKYEKVILHTPHLNYNHHHQRPGFRRLLHQ